MFLADVGKLGGLKTILPTRPSPTIPVLYSAIKPIFKVFHSRNIFIQSTEAKFQAHHYFFPP